MLNNRWRKRNSQPAVISRPTAIIKTSAPPTTSMISHLTKSEKVASYRSTNSLAARFKNLMQNVHEELQCSICLDDYDMPRLLNCGHSYCTACLKSIQSNPNNANCTIKCPTCRQVTKVPGSLGAGANVMELPLNYPLLQIQDVIRSSGGGHGMMMLCETHSNEEVKFYCYTCASVLCSECICAHSPVDSSDTSDASEGGCRRSHSGHRVETLKVAALELFQRVHAENRVAAGAVDACNSDILRLKRDQIDLVDNCDVLSEQVAAEYEFIIKSLEQRRASVLQDIETRRRLEMEKLQAREETVTFRKLEVEKALAQSDKLISTHRALLDNPSFPRADSIKHREVLAIWKDGPGILEKLQAISLASAVSEKAAADEKVYIDCEFPALARESLVAQVESYGSVSTTGHPHVATQVFVKGVDGKSHVCNMFVWETSVHQLMEKIEVLTHIPVDVQRIYHQGKLLYAQHEVSGSKMRLSDFNVRHESIVHLGLANSIVALHGESSTRRFSTPDEASSSSPSIETQQ